MSSDFQKLSEKIIQLAEMTQQLRRENAELRLRTAELASDNSRITQRMQEAHQRVTVLMEKYPAPIAEEVAP